MQTIFWFANIICEHLCDILYIMSLQNYIIGPQIMYANQNWFAKYKCELSNFKYMQFVPYFIIFIFIILNLYPKWYFQTLNLGKRRESLSPWLTQIAITSLYPCGNKDFLEWFLNFYTPQFREKYFDLSKSFAVVFRIWSWDLILQFITVYCDS